MTEVRNSCRCNDKCLNFESCQEDLLTPLLLPYELNPKPVFFGVSMEPYVNQNGDEFLTDSNLYDSLRYAVWNKRFCFFCNKTTETKDESCTVCGLSKQNKE